MSKKILTIFLTVLLLGFAGAGILLSARVADMVEDLLADTLRGRAQTLRPLLTGHLSDPDALQELLHVESGRGSAARVTVIDAAGNVLADSVANPKTMENHADRPEVLAARREGIGRNVRFSSSINQQMLYVALPLDPEHPQDVILRLALPVQSILEETASLNRKVMSVLLVVGLMAAVGGGWILRRAMHPLLEMKDVTEAIGRGDVSRKAPLDLGGEMGQLAAAINRMAEQLSARINALTREKEKLATVITSMEEGVIALDAQLRVLHCNAAALALLDIGVDVTGQPLLDYARTEALLLALKSVQDSGAGGSFRFEHSFRTLEATVNPLPMEDGIVVVLRDVTEAVKYETLRTEFVGNVSHELRTPLAIIRGFVETLQDGGIHDPDQALNFLAKIEKNVGQLSNLVDDLLTLSKMESQVDVAVMASVDPAALVQGCARDLESLIQAKSHELKVELQANLPKLEADGELLRRAIKNLIENAAKYTAAGGQIILRARAENGSVVFEVQDNGPGIPEEFQARIFERFYRVDKSRSRDMGGTGLGLSIVKHVMQVHHGSVQVRSRPGKGATFLLTVPLRSPANAR